MFKTLLISLSGLVLIFAHGGSFAGEISRDIVDAATHAATDAAFSELERHTIRDYFSTRHTEDEQEKHKHAKGKGKNKGLPPGLARKEHLPPGLQKHLERNGTLPPGLAKRDLPPDLSSRLPPVQEGLERVIADTNVVLVDKASGIIQDIIEDIVR